MSFFISSHPNNNSSFSELIDPEDSETQNQPPYFDNNLSRQDCNSKIIFLWKKKKSESSTNECINGQYSRDRFISEKESEIKIISKIFKQKTLNSQEIDNLNEESYFDKIYFLNEDKLNESSNLTSKKINLMKQDPKKRI